MTDSARNHSLPSDASTEAQEAFAEYLALCEQALADGRGRPDFEEWVRSHPAHEAELRELESDWKGFDALLGDALRAAGEESFFRRTPRVGTPTAGSPELVPGARVAGFRLIERIGLGGMGEVWSAEELGLQRTVALKFIRPDRQSARSRAYFDREARAGGRLEHPGIVKVHSTGGQGELHWIAQELVPGSSTLRDFLDAAHGWDRLPRGYFERVARLVAQVCDALHVAHLAGVVHRDVKPQNVLITGDDRPKLSDFGLARLTDESAFSGTYSLKGTPIYMSPEQVTGRSKHIDHRTDVYSTGAVLFELLALRRPFEGESSEVLRRIVDTAPPDPRTFRPEIPAELAAITLKALEGRPSDRYQTAQELALDLRRYLAHEPIQARPDGPLRRARKWCRRHPTRTAVAGLGLLLAGVALGLGGRARSAAERTDAARQEVLLNRAWQAIDASDLERASAELDEFAERYPDDPRGHLAMAFGYAKELRLEELERELALVEDSPWSTQGGEDEETARALFLEAVQWLAEDGRPAWARVERNLARAVELDPGLEVAYFPLYGLRRWLDDPQGARAALQAYRAILRTRDPSVGVVDAQLDELAGDVPGAIDRLQALRAEVGEQGFADLRAHRVLGRLLLQRYLDERTGEPTAGQRELLREAEAVLSRAVEDQPLGPAPWASLALVCQLRFDLTPSVDQREELNRRSLAYARRSLELDPTGVPAWEALVLSGLRRVQLAPPDEKPVLCADLHQDLDRFAEFAPYNQTLAGVRSDVLVVQAFAALHSGHLDEALALFTRSAELDELQLRARLMVGQLHFMEADELIPESERPVDRNWRRASEEAQGDYAEALDWFESCERLWPRAAPGDLAEVPFSTRVWLMGTCDALGREDEALAWLDEVVDMLERGFVPSTEDALNLAEFASTGDPVLRDCQLVQRLLASYPIEATYGEVQADLLARIRSACGL